MLRVWKIFGCLQASYVVAARPMLYHCSNTAGSLCLVGSKTYKDATVITQVLDSGTQGKLSRAKQICPRGETHARLPSPPKSQSNGWSAWEGQTLGEFYPNQDPRGNSSGSAVGLSLDLAAFTVAVEVRTFDPKFSFFVECLLTRAR